MATVESLMTVEEYAQMPANGRRTVLVRGYTADEPDTILKGDDLLEFPPLLPGVSVAVRRFFE